MKHFVTTRNNIRTGRMCAGLLLDFDAWLNHYDTDYTDDVRDDGVDGRGRMLRGILQYCDVVCRFRLIRQLL